MMVSSAFLLIPLVALVCASSAPAPPSLPAMTYEEFRKLPYEQRREAIGELPLDTRVRAYLDMVDELHPPDLLLASRIAPAGSELVQATWRVLRDESDEGRFSYGVFLLKEIQQGGHADVKENLALLRFLERRIEAMTGPRARGLTADWLDKIRGN